MTMYEHIRYLSIRYVQDIHKQMWTVLNMWCDGVRIIREQLKFQSEQRVLLEEEKRQQAEEERALLLEWIAARGVP